MWPIEGTAPGEPGTGCGGRTPNVTSTVIVAKHTITNAAISSVMFRFASSESTAISIT